MANDWDSSPAPEDPRSDPEFEALLAATIEHLNEAKAPVFKMSSDPRVTKIGHFLRLSSIDELPQLYNVLRGDMSLVGPRPDVPAQRDGYTEQEWQVRHRVRPGITGLAQATVRSDARPGERKALDLQYVENVSLLLDFKILLLTIRQLTSRGSF